MDNSLANLLFPNVDKDISFYESQYPPRKLSEGAIVTRYAPSPTGFMHIGQICSALVARTFARQTDGVFYLRIEDTDKKRELADGVNLIVRDLETFGIDIDEGMTGDTGERGDYGPYLQSSRKDIYHAFAKHLVASGLAYPCFCSEEDLERSRKLQEAGKERQGYYGRWAKCRDISAEEVAQRINAGEKFVLRLKSPGNYERKTKFKDSIKGEIEFPENDIDAVLLKSNGIPVYHFAHLVDDYLMRTTHVIRGDEWLASVPLHIQLFRAFGFKPPKYAHIAPIMKEDEGNKRKLSKRKDPEAAVSYYHQRGYPAEAVKLYLLNVINSNFEDWLEKELREKKEASMDDFKLDFKKCSVSGALFDLGKLSNVSKNYISRLSTQEVFASALAHAKEFDPKFASILEADKSYSLNVFGIERGGVKPRKDIACFEEVKNSVWYMYDKLFAEATLEYQFQKITDKNEISRIVSAYLEKYYSEQDDKDVWFEKIKQLSAEFGYAREVKEYKASPDAYKGHVGDISTILRVVITTQSMTPDLFEIMKLLGKNRMQERFTKWSNI